MVRNHIIIKRLYPPFGVKGKFFDILGKVVKPSNF
jgi:hypothetical protein